MPIPRISPMDPELITRGRGGGRSLRLRSWYGPERTPTAAQDIEAHNIPERINPIFEADLLAFPIGSTVVADWRFVDDRIEFGHLGGDLYFDAEPSGFDDHAANDVS